MSSEKIRKHMIFHGEVQGVGFRFTASQAARMYGCTGWCRNEYDGTVSMEIQGEPKAIDGVVATIMGGRYIMVDNIDIREIDIDPDERSFGVKF